MKRKSLWLVLFVAILICSVMASCEVMEASLDEIYDIAPPEQEYEQGQNPNINAGRTIIEDLIGGGDEIEDEEVEEEVEPAAEPEPEQDDEVDEDDGEDEETEDEPTEEEDFSKYSGIKNIILIIGDGMGFEHIEAGELYSGKNYAFTDWCQTKVNTNSLFMDLVVNTTDSAAAATALATGRLTNNNYVGTNYTGEEFTTILDIAKEKGKRTGIVTTDDIFEATPAGFSAHCSSRRNENKIIKSQLKSGVDLLCGKRNGDCVEMRNEIEAAGYTFCDDFMDASSLIGEEKAYCQFKVGGHYAKVQLNDATAFALDFLSEGDEGFVLVVEQAYIDKYNHDNEFERMLECVDSLNKTVEYVTEWVGDRDDTAIFVTADHESGGLEVSPTQRSLGEYTNENGTIYYIWWSTSHTNKEVGFFSNVEIEFERFSSLGSGKRIKT